MLFMKCKRLYASGVPSQNTSNRHLNRIIGLTVTKTEIFEKVVTVDDFFYFMEDMRIALVRFQAKILNITRGRRLRR